MRSDLALRLCIRLLLGMAVTAPLACAGAAPTAATAAPGPDAGARPKTVYLGYLTAIGNAAGTEEVLPFLSDTAKARAQTAGLETLKGKVPGGVLKLVDEQIDGDKATVIYMGTLPGATGRETAARGTIVLIRQGGTWKVHEEAWAPFQKPTPAK